MYEELVKRLHERIALTTAGSPLQDDLCAAAEGGDMSVLIKGMEMPTRCGRCDMCIKEADGDIDYHYACCITAAVIKNLGEKMEDCPLVPVPPHGRLGDLDALARQTEHERFHHTHTDGLAARHHVAEYGHFLKAISDASTIIEAEEAGG